MHAELAAAFDRTCGAAALSAAFDVGFFVTAFCQIIGAGARLIAIASPDMRTSLKVLSRA
jgi:hypothetical protein